MLELQARLVPLASADPMRAFIGRVRFTPDGLIDAVRSRRATGAAAKAVVDLGDAFIYPGLIDLHSHLGFASLPLWAEPTRTSPFPHHDSWPGARSYRPSISWPAYALIKGAPEALLAYAQVRALAGGTTAIQGWPPANRRPLNQLVRNIDDEELGTGNVNLVRTSALTLTPPELRTRAQHIAAGGGFIYHLAEGQVGSLVGREFTHAAGAGCLRSRLIAIHCTAAGEAEFRQWREHAALAGDNAPGGVVWSPFSNLWLYGQTTDVAAAARHGLSVCLGTDWGPSGTKNLLGELKVGQVWAEEAGLALTPFDLVSMVTAAPGDLLGRCWPHGAGRLEPGRLADLTVIARRHSDPWKNLVMAREADVLLVVVGGRARYGTRELMAACGERSTTSVAIGRQRRHVALLRPDQPERAWTWRAVLDELEQVRLDPDAAIGGGQAMAQAALEASQPGYVGPPAGLVLELDMPGAPGVVAGPPPPGADYSVPPAPSLVHDRAWHRTIPGRAFHGAVLDRLAAYYT